MKQQAQEIQIRTRIVKPFGESLPFTAESILNDERLRGRNLLSFAVPSLPPTLNHQYVQVSRERRGLSAETTTYRDMVSLAIGHRRTTWKPTGQVMALIFLLSPYWLTKRRTMRDVDGDNRIKPLGDAIEKATGVRDFTTWEIHQWKIATVKEIKTVCYLYDLGDVVDVYPSPEL